MGILGRLQAKPANDEGKRAILFLPRTFTSAEFNAFLFAGKAYGIDQKQILRDFKTYLRQGNVPEYVAASRRTGENGKNGAQAC